jgi:hypothetical protein
MNPKQQFSPPTKITATMAIRTGNIIIHNQKERHCERKTYAHIFAAPHGTPLSRRHHVHQLFGWVISPLAPGCPKPTILFPLTPTE